jgi:hypothetical protein
MAQWSNGLRVTDAPRLTRVQTLLNLEKKTLFSFFLKITQTVGG